MCYWKIHHTRYTEYHLEICIFAQNYISRWNMLKTCTFLWEMSLSWRMPSSGLWYRATVTTPRHHNTEAKSCSFPQVAEGLQLVPLAEMCNMQCVVGEEIRAVFIIQKLTKSDAFQNLSLLWSIAWLYQNTYRYFTFSLTETFRSKRLYRSLHIATIISVARPKGREQPSRLGFNPYSGSQTSILS